MRTQDQIDELRERVAELERLLASNPDAPFDAELDRWIGTADVANLLAVHPLTVQKRAVGPKRDPLFPPPTRDGDRNKWTVRQILTYRSARANQQSAKRDGITDRGSQSARRIAKEQFRRSTEPVMD